MWIVLFTVVTAIALGFAVAAVVVESYQEARP
jgi:hypothetical protein